MAREEWQTWSFPDRSASSTTFRAPSRVWSPSSRRSRSRSRAVSSHIGAMPRCGARRSSGRSSTCSSATSGSCRWSRTTRTRAWPAGSCSTTCRREPSIRWSRPAPTRTTRSCARHRRSTSSTSVSDPTVTPPRCSPGTPALDERERFVVENGDDLHPHRRLTFTFPAIERAALAVVTVAGEEKREPIRRIRAGEDLPGARIRARQVLWVGDRSALEAD